MRTAYGQLSVPDWGNDLIVRTLRSHGEWSWAEQQLLAPLIRAEDSMWDVGAFLGTFALGVAQLSAAPPARIVAVEPNPALYPHLLANLDLNAPCPADIAPVAVGPSEGWLRPRHGSGDGNAGALAYESSQDGDGSVLCTSLKKLRGTYGDYDVLKLDIEGMENDAICSDIDYISRQLPVIWVECNEGLPSIPLLETLAWLKYEPLYVAFPAFRTANFNCSPERIFPMAYEAALLAAPPERIHFFTGIVPGEETIVRSVQTPFDLRRALWSTPRWSTQEWADMAKPELIAILGRVAQKQRSVQNRFDLRRALWSTPRWSTQEWTDMAKPELIAILGRIAQKQELVSFLNPDAPEASDD